MLSHYLVPSCESHALSIFEGVLSRSYQSRCEILQGYGSTSSLYESSDYLNSQSFLFLFSFNAQTLIINILLLLISSETGKTYEYNTRTNARRWVTTANGTAVMDSPLQIMLHQAQN